MSSYDTLNRRKYLELPTHQKRLRHLRSIAARNLSLPSGCKQSDVSHLQAYFTLHTDVQAKEFYSSEFAKGSLNPIWRSFDLSRIPDLDVTSSYLVVKIWLGQDLPLNLCVEWTVNLTGLTYLGEQIVVEGKKYPPNSVVFGMWDAYFGVLDDNDSTEGDSGEPIQHLEAMLSPSYCINMLTRVYSVLRAIKQTEALVSRVRQSIEDQLVASRNKSEKLSEKEMLILKVSKLKVELECRAAQLNALRITHEQIQAKNRNKDSILHTKNKALARDRDRLQEKKKGYFDAREKFVKTNAQLIMRKKQLIAELAFIYPVLEIPPQSTNHSGSPFYTICGVRLPNSEDFQGQDETMVAVGLGYTAHMVSMIAQFLDVPLRYPIQHRSSKSKVHDHITDKLLDKDRDFPLYSKGKDKFHFNYAVYLLNKNIAQIRYYCGMGTNDLRLTLPNLKALLEMRLGVKFDESSDLRPRKLLSVNTSNASTPVSSGNPSPSTMTNSQAQENAAADANGTASHNQLTNSQNHNKLKKSPSPGSDHSNSSSNKAASLTKTAIAEGQSVVQGGETTVDNLSHKFKIDLLHEHVDSTYSEDKSQEPPSTNTFEAQFIRPDSVTRGMPGFRGVDICDSGEGSSSDDNMASKYSAKFKTWQHNPALQADYVLTDNKSKGAAGHERLSETRTIVSSEHTNVVDSSSRSFKTKGMTKTSVQDAENINNDKSYSSKEADIVSSQLFQNDTGKDVFHRAENFGTGKSSFNTIKNRKDRSDSGKS